MRVTVLNQEKKENPIFRSIILLILGIILTIHSNEFISFLFTILGIIVLFYGIFKFVRYYQLKKNLKIDSSDILVSGVFSCILGFLVIFLSNFFVSILQIVSGVWMILLAISKYHSALFIRDHKQQFITECISSIILLLLGIYTIFAQNVVFIFIGMVLILYSVVDIFKNFIQKK